MEIQELYLKTVFSCMACDGDIAPEEIGLVKQLATNTKLFASLDVEKAVNNYVEAINKDGRSFFVHYLDDIVESQLTEEEQINIIELAFKTITTDNAIAYAEVSFFKKIRARLSLTDDEILAKCTNMDSDFLLPDINARELPEWSDDVVIKTFSL